MARRYEFTRAQWELVRDVLPPAAGRGRRRSDDLTMLNGMMWILWSGARWRELPDRYGPWQTVYHRFNLYRRDGTLDRMLERLQLELDGKGYIEWDVWCVDATSVRAVKAAAGAGKKGAA